MKKTTKKTSASKTSQLHDDPTFTRALGKAIRSSSTGAMHENQVRAKKRQLRKKYK